MQSKCSELTFKSQDDIDNFNEHRWGYKSIMPGFEEDKFA